MARYLKTAESAQYHINALLSLLPPEKMEEAAIHIARIFNAGVRVSPRGVQSTVRLNAVRKATEHLPISVSMVKVKANNGYEFNALQVLGKSGKTIEDPTLNDSDQD